MSGIHLLLMGGISDYVNPLPGGSVSDSASSSQTAGCAITITTTGLVVATNTFSGPSFRFSHKWHNGTPSSNHWVRFDLISGDAPVAGSDATGTWHQLTVDRAIAYNVTNGVLSGTFRIRIAVDSSGTSVVCDSVTGSYSMQAQSSG